MSNSKGDTRKRSPNPLSKEERAKEALLAMREYEAARKAELDKTARLREMRLARDAALAATPPAPIKARKRAGKKPAS